MSTSKGVSVCDATHHRINQRDREGAVDGRLKG